MSPKELLIRFDANNQIGIGHAVRCIEIAKYIKENSKLKVIVCTSRNNLMLQELSDAKVTDNILFDNHTTEEEFIEFISSVYPNSILMIDKLYNYSRNFIKGISTKVKVIMFHNDCEGMLDSHTVIFPIAHLSTELKKKIINVNPLNFYEGFEYVVINEYVKKYPSHQILNNPYMVVTTGGSDPKNMIFTITQWLEKCDIDVNVVILCGAYYKKKESLVHYIQNMSSKVKISVKPFNYGCLFEAELAISAFGVTPYELIFRHIPVITFGHTVKAAKGSDALEKKTGANISLGMFDKINQKDFCQCVEKAWEERNLKNDYIRKKEYIDGNGIERIANIIFNIN
jgi:spore coat polysaccharide biosynthesis predicted glycosyltransferase SpsG